MSPRTFGSDRPTRRSRAERLIFIPIYHYAPAGQPWLHGSYTIQVAGMWPPRIPNPAIRESIRKWRVILRLLKEDKVVVQAGRNCPLCYTYWQRGAKNPCHRCPIFKVTRQKWCRGTPFRPRPSLADARAFILFLRAVLVLNHGE
jgi:hypothetical protein